MNRGFITGHDRRLATATEADDGASPAAILYSVHVDTEPRLQFKVLGPFLVLRDGVSVDVGGPKQRAVLAALLLAAGRAVSTDRLVDVVWGNGPPPSAVSTLHAYVSNLRRVLEPERGRRAPSRVLVSQSRGYTLDVPHRVVDSRRFESLTVEGRALLSQDQPAEALSLLDQALALWRGEAFAGFTEESLVGEATRLNELRALAKEARIEALLAQGEHEAVIPELEAMVAGEPLRERLLGLLMVALHRCGRTAHALDRYQEARRRLADELGLEPGPELKRLQTAVLSQSADLEWRPRSPKGAVTSGDADSSPLAATAAPLVGRNREVGILGRVLTQVAAGDGRVLLIFGEPGIGKTRIAEELASLATARGMEVSCGACLEAEVAPPFWPWVQAFRELDRKAGEQTLSDLLPDALREQDAPFSRGLVYAPIATALIERASSQPLVLILDDLQWADMPSLELLHFVAAAGKQDRLMLAGTYRDTELDPGHPLLETLGALTHDAQVDRVALGGLDLAAVKEVIAETIGGQTDDDVTAAVHARTEGNPFFLSEMVRLLQAEGAMDAGDSRAVLQAGVPLSVRDVIARRLARLPAQTSELLDLAAVAGREFDLSLLERAGERSSGSVLDALEPALLRRIISTSSTRVGGVRFIHDLVREAIYDNTPPIRRTRLHAKMAEALVGMRADDPASVAEVAYHFWRGAVVAGSQRALPHVLAAADRAASQLAYERAEEHLSHGLALLESLPPSADNDATRLHIAARLARYRWMLRGYAAPETEQALAIAQELGAGGKFPAELLSVLWGLGGYYVVRAELDHAEQIADRLLAIGGETADPDFLTVGHEVAGVVAVHRGKTEEARSHLERAVEDMAADGREWADEGFHQEVFLHARFWLAVAYALAGRGAEARSTAEQAIAQAERSSEPFGLAATLVFSAWAAVLAEDAETAKRHGARGRVLASEQGFRLWEALGSVWLGWAIARLGNPEQGEGLVHGGISGMGEVGGRVLMPCLVGLLAEVQEMAGRNVDAERTLARAFEHSQRSGEHFFDDRLRRLETRLGRHR